MSNYDEMKSVNAERESSRVNDKTLEKERQKQASQVQDQHARASNNDIQTNKKDNIEKSKEKEQGQQKFDQINANYKYAMNNLDKNCEVWEQNKQDESHVMQKYREHQVIMQEKILTQQKEQSRIQGKELNMSHDR